MSNTDVKCDTSFYCNRCPKVFPPSPHLRAKLHIHKEMAAGVPRFLVPDVDAILFVKRIVLDQQITVRSQRRFLRIKDFSCCAHGTLDFEIHYQ